MRSAHGCGRRLVGALEAAEEGLQQESSKYVGDSHSERSCLFASVSGPLETACVNMKCTKLHTCSAVLTSKPRGAQLAPSAPAAISDPRSKSADADEPSQACARSDRMGDLMLDSRRRGRCGADSKHRGCQQLAAKGHKGWVGIAISTAYRAIDYQGVHGCAPRCASACARWHRRRKERRSHRPLPPPRLATPVVKSACADRCLCRWWHCRCR